MADCFELFDSRHLTCDERTYITSLTTTWKVEGLTDQDEIRNLLLSTAPATYTDSILGRILPRYTHSIDQQDGPDSWSCTVVYQTVDLQSGANNAPTGTTIYSFDTTGGTRHINVAEVGAQTVYGNSNIPKVPIATGALGISRDNPPAGIDIGAKTLKFSEIHRLPAEMITISYIDALVNLTYCTNNTPWRVWDAAQVLFTGATGTGQDDGTVTITYNFEVGVNFTGLDVGPPGSPITIDINAHDHFEIDSIPYVDAGAKIMLSLPVACYVTRIYSPGDFTLLGI